MMDSRKVQVLSNALTICGSQSVDARHVCGKMTYHFPATSA